MKSSVFLSACVLAAAALLPAHAAAPVPASRAVPPASITQYIASRSAAGVEIVTLRLADLWELDPDWPREEFAGAGTGAARAGPRRVFDPARDVASGVIVAADGLILTNAHVVAEADEVQVLLADGRRFPSRVLGLDLDTDVALLKIEAAGLPVAVIGDSSALAAGDWVFAIGAPFGFQGSVTGGIVSASNRLVTGAGRVALIQTDVAINPGSSGGPLLNLRGEVVGINSVIYSGSGGYMGVSFAVPINLAMKVAAQLRKDGKVVRPHLGVETQEVTPALAKAFRLPKAGGALVLRVESDSPAQAGGLAAGDILLAVDGSPIGGVADLLARIDERLPGTRSVLQVWRRAALLSLPVTLAAASSSAPPVTAAPAPEWRQGLGLELTEPSATHLSQLRAANGLLVQDAVGAARSEGIRPGDLIVALDDQPIARLADFRRLLAAAAPGSTVALLVLRDGRLAYVPIRMPPQPNP
jgi:serine protease Do